MMHGQPHLGMAAQTARATEMVASEDGQLPLSVEEDAPSQQLHKCGRPAFPSRISRSLQSVATTRISQAILTLVPRGRKRPGVMTALRTFPDLLPYRRRAGMMYLDPDIAHALPATASAHA